VPASFCQTPDAIFLPRQFGKLVIISGGNAGKEYQCYSRITLIGRTRENHVVINDTFTSRIHARIELRDGDFIVVEDLNSINGTILNQRTISRAILNHGDKFQIGEMVLQFTLDESSQPLPDA